VFVKMLECRPKSWQELASKAHWPPIRTGHGPTRIGKAELVPDFPGRINYPYQEVAGLPSKKMELLLLPPHFQGLAAAPHSRYSL
jgi:hypothetical protein